MKTVKSKLKLAVVIISYTILMVSCKDTAPKPSDETLDKEHGNWYKVEFKFTQGHIHGHDDHDHEGHDHDHDEGEEFFHGLPSAGTHLKTVQVYSFSNPNKPGEGIVVDSKDPIRLIKGLAYGLEITYYSKNGEKMNGEFTTDKMAAMHQHFFVPKAIESIKEGVQIGNKSELIHYEYRDTKPWDGMFGSEGVTLRGEKDPIGLKGFFDVELSYQKFDLNVILVHVIVGSKLDDDGNAYPFYNPSPRLLGTQDLNLKIPVRIFTVYPKTDAEYDNYVSEIAKEFNITEEEAKKDLDSINSLDPESSNYKL